MVRRFILTQNEHKHISDFYKNPEKKSSNTRALYCRIRQNIPNLERDLLEAKEFQSRYRAIPNREFKPKTKGVK